MARQIPRHDDGDDDDQETIELDRLRAPIDIDVLVPCPNCDMEVTIRAKLTGRVTKDSDGSGALGLRVRSAKAMHVCGQASLGLVEGPRVR